MAPPLSVQEIIRTRRNRTAASMASLPIHTRTLSPTLLHEDDAEDVARPSRAADLHKSLFSMVQAAGRSSKFQNRFDHVSSDDEQEQDDDEQDTRKQKWTPPSKIMEASQILTPARRDTKKSDSSEEPAPFLSMILKGEARMEASDHDIEKPGAASGIPELEEPSPKSLAQRLRDIFDLEELEDVVSEYPCWLLHKVLLSGHLYITTSHICFYAYCPKLTATAVKSGWLRKRGYRNPKYRNYYMELKGDVLRYYHDRTDIYEPSGHIDLRFGISATIEPESKKAGKERSPYFKVVVKDQEFFFMADSHETARDWVKHLQRVIFRSHNSGDSVKISLPIRNIINAEEEKVLDASDTLKLQVVEDYESYGLDEYFFSFFENGPDAIRELLDLIDLDIRNRDDILGEITKPPTSRPKSSRRSSEAVRNTLHPYNFDPESRRSSFESSSVGDGKSRSRSRPRRDTEQAQLSTPSRSRGAASEQSPAIESIEDSDLSPPVQSLDESQISASQILNRSDVFRSPTSRILRAPESDSDEEPVRKPRVSHDTLRDQKRVSSERPRATQAASSSSIAGYIQAASLHDIVKSGVKPLSKVSNVAKYITDQSKRLTTESYEKVTGLWHGQYKHYDSRDVRPDDDLIEGGNSEHYAKRFRDHFALPDSEPLVATYYVWFMRLLGNYGKIYVGKRFVCYRSFATRTKLIFPIDKLESVKKVSQTFIKSATGSHDLIITAQGHESLFFSFSAKDSRDDCYGVILKAMDALEKVQLEDGNLAHATMAEYRSLRGGGNTELERQVTKRLAESGEDVPPILFDDPNVSFLAFKPPKPMKITLLTIGSRGDVQPFIALGKALKAEGHSVKIATHGEFESWIRKHGLEFGNVGGDPGELMRLCIEYGMFTFQFLVEARSKFSGWIDDLLVTAWKACQGSDLIIESPSAMAGIHIAEALKIPYFRAFTMPWTRTRAYPHAFYVPENKRSGSFNYYSYVLIDQVFWTGTAGNVNKWRKRTLNLPPTSLEQMQSNKVPFLYNFSPRVVPSPLDYPDWIRVTGYWFLDEGDVWTPPVDLLDFMHKAKKDGKKLVYIGFGSILVEDPAAMTKTIIEAVVQADVRCVLAKGWSDRQTKTIVPAAQQKGAAPIVEEELPFPPEIFPIKSIPHDWLFPQMDAVVHHAGSGTTGASLRAGVPTIVKPFFGDQFFFAMRIEDLGVGICLKRLTAVNFRKALKDATTDGRIIEAARKLGEKIREEDGVKNAINAIYRDLDYAKSLIKRAPGAADGDHEGKSSAEEIEEHWTFVEPDSGNELSQ